MTEQGTAVRIIEPKTSAPTGLTNMRPGNFPPVSGTSIRLDLEDGTLYAAPGRFTGDGMPWSIWLGRTLEWAIPAVQPQTALTLMREIVPYCATILAHSEIVWNGLDNVGRVDSEAKAAEDIIRNGSDGILDMVESDVYVWQASDWFEPTSADLVAELRGRGLLKQAKRDEAVDYVEATYDGDGSDEERPYLLDIEGFVHDLILYNEED